MLAHPGRVLEPERLQELVRLGGGEACVRDRAVVVLAPAVERLLALQQCLDVGQVPLARPLVLAVAALAELGAQDGLAVRAAWGDVPELAVAPRHPHRGVELGGKAVRVAVDVHHRVRRIGELGGCLLRWLRRVVHLHLDYGGPCLGWVLLLLRHLDRCDGEAGAVLLCHAPRGVDDLPDLVGVLPLGHADDAAKGLLDRVYLAPDVLAGGAGLLALGGGGLLLLAGREAGEDANDLAHRGLVLAPGAVLLAGIEDGLLLGRHLAGLGLGLGGLGATASLLGLGSCGSQLSEGGLGIGRLGGVLLRGRGGLNKSGAGGSGRGGRLSTTGVARNVHLDRRHILEAFFMMGHFS